MNMYASLFPPLDLVIKHTKSTNQYTSTT